MKALIESIIVETINNKFPNESIRNFLLSHPIKGKMVDNLLGEIKKSEMVLSGMTGDLRKKRDAIKSVVEGVTLLFARTALSEKESELKKDSISNAVDCDNELDD